MAKSFLYRTLGIGEIPTEQRPILDAEGVELVDEGIGGSITFKNYKAPGKFYWRRRSWFTGSIVLTSQRFAAFRFRTPVINIPLERKWIEKLDLTAEEGKLHVMFNARIFDDHARGTIELRFTTELAGSFLRRLGQIV